MKKQLIIVGLVIALVSCSVDKEIISKSEFAKWSSKNDTIFYNNKPAAYYDHSEYELNPGHGKYAKQIQSRQMSRLPHRE